MKRVLAGLLLLAFCLVAFGIDPAANFSKSTLVTGIDADDLSIDVQTGHGARFPTAPFNAIIWNQTDYPDPSDAYWAGECEIVRVTVKSTDTFTITRAQEGTSAVTHNTGGKTYGIIYTLTAKFFDDVQPIDSDLTRLGGIGAGSALDFIVRDATGWTNFPNTGLPMAIFTNLTVREWFKMTNVTGAGVAVFDAAHYLTNSVITEANILTEAEAALAYQPLDADLTTWAGVTPGTGVGTFLATPSSANLRGALTDESGTGVALFAGGDVGAATATTPAANDNDTSVATTAFVQTELADYQPLDTDLTRIGGIGAGTALDVIWRDSTGWTNSSLNAIVHSDTAWASSWNGVTTNSPSKNAIYDWGHAHDSDDDGKVDTVDIATAGLVQTTAAGVISQLAYDTYQASNTVLTTLTTDADILRLRDSVATAGHHLIADANGWTNKQMYGYIVLTHPALSGSTALIYTNNSGAAYYGQAAFANNGTTNNTWAEYRLTVPPDIDTAVDLVCTQFKFYLGGADTASHGYAIGMDGVADSAAASLAQWVSLAFAGDGSGADGDVETVSATTLTAWKDNLTAGQLWVIRVNRDGAGVSLTDASTVNSYSGPIVIRYGKTQ